MIEVKGYAVSGNCWKVAQILNLTGTPYRWTEVNSNAGESRTPEFLRLNPNGKVPIVVLDDGVVITESAAILLHFAEGTPWLPPPGLQRTRVMEWLFFEQYSHEPYIAVARNLVGFLNQADAQPQRLAQCRTGGERALAIMERRLASSLWLTDHGPTVADIALCAYTQVAEDGGFVMRRWPGIVAWIERVHGLPGIVPLTPL